MPNPDVSAPIIAPGGFLNYFQPGVSAILKQQNADKSHRKGNEAFTMSQHLTSNFHFTVLYLKTASLSIYIVSQAVFLILFVRTKGLEPPRLTAPDPKSGAATNYATSAQKRRAKVKSFLSFHNIPAKKIYKKAKLFFRDDCITSQHQRFDDVK